MLAEDVEAGERPAPRLHLRVGVGHNGQVEAEPGIVLRDGAAHDPDIDRGALRFIGAALGRVGAIGLVGDADGVHVHLQVEPLDGFGVRRFREVVEEVVRGAGQLLDVEGVDQPMLPPEDVQRLVGLAIVRVLGQPIDLEAEAEAADGRPPLAVFVCATAVSGLRWGSRVAPSRGPIAALMANV